jgi:hypothetical protein
MTKERKGERKLTIRRAIKQFSSRTKEDHEREKISGRIYEDMCILAMKLGYFDKEKPYYLGSETLYWPRFPETPFPYLDPDKDSPLFHIKFSIKYHKDYEKEVPRPPHAEYFTIDFCEDAAHPYKRLFLIREGKLEGPTGKEISKLNQLRKSQELIAKIIAAAYTHLPPASTVGD